MWGSGSSQNPPCWRLAPAQRSVRKQQEQPADGSSASRKIRSEPSHCGCSGRELFLEELALLCGETSTHSSELLWL